MYDSIILEILNNEVKLDEVCYNCGRSWCTDKNGVCEFCKGSGFKLTPTGEAIIDLVKRHLKEVI